MHHWNSKGAVGQDTTVASASINPTDVLVTDGLNIVVFSHHRTCQNLTMLLLL